MSETVKKTFKTDLSSLEPYILGKKFTGVCKKTVDISSDTLKRFLTMLEEDPIAKDFFNIYELSSDFYSTMVDFNHFFSDVEKDEVFYAAKIGKMYRQVPSFCVYVIKKAWDSCYGIPNLISKVLPVSALKKFFEEGYLRGGVTLKDVICNICTEEYNPICLYRPVNKLTGFVEVYVESTDMVAAIPHSIADSLDDSAISSIKVTANGLETQGVLLRTMCGKVGAVNSVYDLRNVL